MCDRCSRSHFHAPRLNNSPGADNPCTLDHLRGTAEPGKFRLLPSVGFCATAAPAAPGHSRNLVSTQPNTHLFIFLLFSLRVLPAFCRRRGLLLLLLHQPASQRWDYPATPHKWQPPRAAVLSCRPPFQRDLGSRLRRPGMASSPVGGDVLAAEASYAQTAAASGWKGWHLLTAFLSLSSPLPIGRHGAPRRGRGLQG